MPVKAEEIERARGRWRGAKGLTNSLEPQIQGRALKFKGARAEFANYAALLTLQKTYV